MTVSLPFQLKGWDDMNVENEIIKLRKEQRGYSQIAKMIGSTKETVRYYCIKHNLTGTVGLISSKKPKAKKIYTCIVCGNKLDKPSKYCEICLKQTRRERARQKYAESITQTLCVVCGKPKDSRNIKYCSDDCRNHEMLMVTKQVCQYCGVEFTTHKIKKYCSIRCARRQSVYVKHSKRRERMIMNGQCDWSITIPKLIERDKVCQICGGHVDENDKRPGRRTVIVGNSYPSIDHIIPVSKGGTHTWDNVQLAHKGCNSIKSDTTNIVIRDDKLVFNL